MTDFNNDPLTQNQPVDLTDLVTIFTNSKRQKRENELDTTPKRIQESVAEDDRDKQSGFLPSRISQL